MFYICSLPKPRIIGRRPNLVPYFLIGDEAFPLKEYLLRPYPKKCGLNAKKKVFNMRLSKARKSVERAFGMMAQRFRIFRKPIQLKLTNIENVIKASICLHNWLFNENEAFTDGDTEFSTNLLDVCINSNNSPSSNGKEVREVLTDYFMLEGAKDYQWHYI